MSDTRPPYSRIALVVTLALILLLVILDYFSAMG